MQSNRPAEALESLSRALELKPSNVEIWNNLGNTKQVAHDFDGAIVAYKEALKRDRTYADAAGNLLLALSNQALQRTERGQFNEALASYDTVLLIDPQNQNARQRKAQLLQHLSASQ